MRHSHSRFTDIMTLSLMACSIHAASMESPENPSGVSAPRHPVKYLVKEKSNINNEMKEPGDTVMYDGLPAENLEPLCDVGRARYQEYLESNTDRVAKMIRDNKNSEHNVGDPKAFMVAVLKQREEDRKELAEQLAKQSASQAEAIGTAVGQAMVQAFAMFFPNGLPVAASAAPPVVAAPAASENTKPDTDGTGKQKK